MLALVVFFSGAILMALEILGSRVLAPHFGSSIFVWGSLIGIVLAALSLGNYAGGALADARPSRRVLAAVLALAGVGVLAVPLLTPTAARLAALGPRGGPLAAAMLLFFLPSVLMGMVSPFALRLTGTGPERLGRMAGRFYALSTAGSIAGTLVTSFWLIPALGTALLITLLGAALLAMGAGLLVGERRNGTATILWVTAAAAALLVALPLSMRSLVPESGAARPADAGAAEESIRSPGTISDAEIPPPVETAPAESDSAGETAQDEGSGRYEVGPWGQPLQVIYETESAYHSIRVTEGAGIRHLRFDNSYQSAMDLQDPYRNVYSYTGYFHLPLALRPELREGEALFVGLGGGSAPRRFWRDYPEMQVRVVELDPAVVEVARRFFDLPADPRFQVAVGDGRRYLAETDQRYDLILLDAYFADAIPFHLTTREFFTLVEERLQPDGMVAANIIGSLSGSRSALYRSVLRTMKAVFPAVAVFAVDGPATPGQLQNLILIAGEGPFPSAEGWQEQAWQAVEEGVVRMEALPAYAGHQVPLPANLAAAQILTDDHAPVDHLLHLRTDD